MKSSSHHGSTWLVLDDQWLLLPSGREANSADDTAFYLGVPLLERGSSLIVSLSLYSSKK